MFQPAPSSGAASKGSAFHRAAGALGTALGIAAAILLTPLIYRRTRPSLHAYLTDAYGADFSEWLTLAFGGVEGFCIYAATRLLFVSAVVWIFAALAARRF